MGALHGVGFRELKSETDREITEEQSRLTIAKFQYTGPQQADEASSGTGRGVCRSLEDRQTYLLFFCSFSFIARRSLISDFAPFSFWNGQIR